MISIYPDNLIHKVLDQLNALDVLELIDWHPESIQLNQSKIRVFCPIHRETQYRTLVVDTETRRYLCSRLTCSGSEGGDLIQLLALAHRIHYDEALRILIDEYSIKVELAAEPEEIYRKLVEAENRLQLARVDENDRGRLLQEARVRLDEVLEKDPENIRALRAQVLYLRQTESFTEFEPWIIKLSIAEQDAKKFDRAVKLLKDAIDADESNLNLRKRLGDLYAQTDHKDDALEQYMILADYAEGAESFQVAIEAYRSVDALPDSGIDVTPMIAQLLMLLDNNVEAAREMVRQADKARADGQLDESQEILTQALEIDPANEDAVQSLIRTQIDMGISRDQFMVALRHVDKLMEKGAWGRVIDILNLMDEHAPDDTNIIERLIVSYSQNGEMEEARKARLKVLGMYRKEGDREASKMMLDDILMENAQDKEALRESAELAVEMDDQELAIIRYKALELIYEKEKDYDEAIGVYKRLVEIAPDSSRIATGFVALLVRLERKKQGIKVLSETIKALKKESNMLGLRQVVEQGLELAPERPEFLIDYGIALEALGESVKASVQIVKACQLFNKRNRHEEAKEELLKLLERDPDISAALRELAVAYRALEEEEKAVEQEQHLAVLQFKQGDYHECCETLRRLAENSNARVQDLERYTNVTRILKLDEENRKAHLLLAEKYREQGEFNEAIQQVQGLIESGSNDDTAQRLLIQLYREKGDTTQWGASSWSLALRLRRDKNFEQEKVLLKEIIQERPRDFEARERVIELLSDQQDADEEIQQQIEEYLKESQEAGELARASDFMKTVAEKNTDSVVYQSSLVSLYQAAEQVEEQEAQLESLITLLESQNQLEETIPRYKELIEINPTETKRFHRLSEILFDLDKPQEAIEVLLELAEFHAHNHRHSEAEDVFEEIFERDPENEAAYLGLAQFYISRGGHEKEAVRNLREAALLRVKHGDMSGALETLTSAFTVIPNSPLIQREIVNLYLDPTARDEIKALEALEKLTEFYQAAGQDDYAFSSIREQIHLRPDDEKLRKKLIAEFVERDRLREALEELISLGQYLRDQKEYKRALEICKEAEDLEVASVAPNSLRAEIYEAMGEKDKALDIWRELAPSLQKVAGQSAAQNLNPASALYSNEKGRKHASGLMVMREYDFDHFIVGEGNRFACATAKAIAKAPGNTPHNPLFIHADVGLGKTHILHSIANHLFEQKNKMHVVYTNAEEFTSELIDAIQENTLNEFRNRYKSCDMILIDDIHFLAGKESAQEEFFHLFNTLYQSKKQIVITSDRPPREIAHLEKRLKSRFGSGVIIGIKAPDIETRAAILRREAKKYPEITVPDELLTKIAETVNTNIRELKGSFNQLITQHMIGESPMNTETLNIVLENYQPTTS